MVTLSRRVFNVKNANPVSITITLTKQKGDHININIKVNRYQTNITLREKNFTAGEFTNSRAPSDYLRQVSDGYYEMVMSQWLIRSLNIELNHL